MIHRTLRACVGPFVALLLLVVVTAAGCSRSNGGQPSSGEPSKGEGTESRKPRTAHSGVPGAAVSSGEHNQERPASASLPGKESGGPRAAATPPTALAAIATERITGYKTSAEYLVVESRRIPIGLACVTLPADYHTRPEKQYPMVIVFGGAGECAKPPRTGALAWLHYYKTDEAIAALGTNVLAAADFRGLVTKERLEQFNATLKRHPYEGIILVCPYSPLLSPNPGLEGPAYEAFIMEELIPEVERRYRVDSERIGVDGVSMGGARSMYYGLKYPEVFAGVGSLQGAFGPYMELYSELIKKNRGTLKERPIQLVTSDGDPLAPSVARLHQLLSDHGIPHRYLTLTGPHDYIFNQGPGSLALLIFHNEALRRRPTGATE